MFRSTFDNSYIFCIPFKFKKYYTLLVFPTVFIHTAVEEPCHSHFERGSPKYLLLTFISGNNT